MNPNDSPSQKRDGTTESHDRGSITTRHLQAEYGAAIVDLQNTKLPDARIEELVRLCINTQHHLDKHDQGNTEDTLTLVNTVAEAIGDVKTATVVSEDELPESRALETGIPADDYVLTTAEREEALDALSLVLFTIVDTPPATGTASAGVAD